MKKLYIINAKVLLGGERQKAHLRTGKKLLSRLLGLSLFEMGQSSDYQSPRQRRIFNCIGWFGDVFLCSLIACHFRFVGWFCHHPFPPRSEFSSW
jgi:hypothetical protein